MSKLNLVVYIIITSCTISLHVPVFVSLLFAATFFIFVNQLTTRPIPAIQTLQAVQYDATFARARCEYGRYLRRPPPIVWVSARFHISHVSQNDRADKY